MRLTAHGYHRVLPPALALSSRYGQLFCAPGKRFLLTSSRLNLLAALGT